MGIKKELIGFLALMIEDDLDLEINLEVLKQKLTSHGGNTLKEIKSSVIQDVIQKNQQKIRELELETKQENWEIMKKINQLKLYTLMIKQGLLEEKQKQQ